MAGISTPRSKANNGSVERVYAGGNIDVEWTGGPEPRVLLGVHDSKSNLYVRVQLSNTPEIDDLIGALQRVRKRLNKAEGG